jgi:hypothetical protein
MIKQLHLDSEYRGRWQEYHLADGRVMDSRSHNWRQVEWERVVLIVTHIRDKRYMTHCKHPDFRFFVVYRWGGHEYVQGRPQRIRQWAVGWSNGERCFMTDLDFKTGAIVRQYVVPVESVQKHIHPRVGGGRYATVADVQ